MHAGPDRAVLSTGQCCVVRAAPCSACPWNCDGAHQLSCLQEPRRVSYGNCHCLVHWKAVVLKCTGFTLIYNSQGANLRWRKVSGNHSSEHGWQELCVWLRDPVEAYTQGCCTTHDSARLAKHRHCQQVVFINYDFKWNSVVSFPVE